MKKEKDTDGCAERSGEAEETEETESRSEGASQLAHTSPLERPREASKYSGWCQGPPAASRPDTAGDRRHDTIRSSPSASKLANKLLKLLELTVLARTSD
ncbi:hypothetical protein G5I_12070 [Acromyrmex echinatior]|uniref:Uncharacterized protein n=1 Tax=Acromyrmex echinatior TaxID=103372 RepID=F4X1B1_ACREC|nr:hypothetical protein G5I_12070 [Acromyrmex echinatior]